MFPASERKTLPFRSGFPLRALINLRAFTGAGWPDVHSHSREPCTALRCTELGSSPARLMARLPEQAPWLLPRAEAVRGHKGAQPGVRHLGRRFAVARVAIPEEELVARRGLEPRRRERRTARELPGPRTRVRLFSLGTVARSEVAGSGAARKRHVLGADGSFSGASTTQFMQAFDSM